MSWLISARGSVMLILLSPSILLRVRRNRFLQALQFLVAEVVQDASDFTNVSVVIHTKKYGIRLLRSFDHRREITVWAVNMDTERVCPVVIVEREWGLNSVTTLGTGSLQQ